MWLKSGSGGLSQVKLSHETPISARILEIEAGGSESELDVTNIEISTGIFWNVVSIIRIPEYCLL